jgi:bacillopeptidase F (M6 metalloprotease family)
MDEYQDKFRDYHFRFNWTSSEPFDPRKETVEVRLTTGDGQEYLANFTTRHYIDYVFKKNKRTGECAKGTYFCMPNMILVEEVSEQNVRKTIDDLINNVEVETHFRKVD